jgi:hypothetical protein
MTIETLEDQILRLFRSGTSRTMARLMISGRMNPNQPTGEATRRLAIFDEVWGYYQAASKEFTTTLSDIEDSDRTDDQKAKDMKAYALGWAATYTDCTPEEAAQIWAEEWE